MSHELQGESDFLAYTWLHRGTSDLLDTTRVAPMLHEFFDGGCIFGCVDKEERKGEG